MRDGSIQFQAFGLLSSALLLQYLKSFIQLPQIVSATYTLKGIFRGKEQNIMHVVVILDLL